MNWLFGSIAWDLATAGLLGAIGGLGFVLLQEKGIEMPHGSKESGTTFLDMGFISDILIGGLAAVITYAISQPSGQLEMIAASIPAGIGGTAILRSYINGKAASENASLAERSLRLASSMLGSVVSGTGTEAGLSGGGAAPGGLVDMGAGSRSSARTTSVGTAQVATAMSQLKALQLEQERISRRWGRR